MQSSLPFHAHFSGPAPRLGTYPGLSNQHILPTWPNGLIAGWVLNSWTFVTILRHKNCRMMSMCSCHEPPHGTHQPENTTSMEEIKAKDGVGHEEGQRKRHTHTHTPPVMRPGPTGPALSESIARPWNFQLHKLHRFSVPFQPAWTRFLATCNPESSPIRCD